MSCVVAAVNERCMFNLVYLFERWNFFIRRKRRRNNCSRSLIEGGITREFVT